MKRLFLAVGLVLGLVALAYAQSASEVAEQVATELKDSGVITTQDAPRMKSSVKDLMKHGASAEDAKNVVAQAAHQAKAQGLKGKDLAAKVHEAVKARKAQMAEAKKKAKEIKKAELEAKRKEKEAKWKLEKESEKAKEKAKGFNKKWGQ